MLSVYCEDCGKDSDFLCIKEASFVAGKTCRTIHRWITSGNLHLMKNAGGHTFICKSSLLRPFTIRLQPQVQV